MGTYMNAFLQKKSLSTKNLRLIKHHWNQPTPCQNRTLTFIVSKTWAIVICYTNGSLVCLDRLSWHFTQIWEIHNTALTCKSRSYCIRERKRWAGWQAGYCYKECSILYFETITAMRNEESESQKRSKRKLHKLSISTHHSECSSLGRVGQEIPTKILPP